MRPSQCLRLCYNCSSWLFPSQKCPIHNARHNLIIMTACKTHNINPSNPMKNKSVQAVYRPFIMVSPTPAPVVASQTAGDQQCDGVRRTVYTRPVPAHALWVWVLLSLLALYNVLEHDPVRSSVLYTFGFNILYGFPSPEWTLLHFIHLKAGNWGGYYREIISGTL